MDTARLKESFARVASFLEALGRGHRGRGTLASHYGPVGSSLLATIAQVHVEDFGWSEPCP